MAPPPRLAGVVVSLVGSTPDRQLHVYQRWVGSEVEGGCLCGEVDLPDEPVGLSGDRNPRLDWRLGLSQS